EAHQPGQQGECGHGGSPPGGGGELPRAAQSAEAGHLVLARRDRAARRPGRRSSAAAIAITTSHAAASALQPGRVVNSTAGVGALPPGVSTKSGTSACEIASPSPQPSSAAGVTI